MNVKKVLIDVVTVFAVSLVVCVVVTFCWSFLVHGAGVVDWETSFRFAIVLAIILPWMGTRASRG